MFDENSTNRNFPVTSAPYIKQSPGDASETVLYGISRILGKFPLSIDKYTPINSFEEGAITRYENGQERYFRVEHILLELNSLECIEGKESYTISLEDDAIVGENGVILSDWSESE